MATPTTTTSASSGDAAPKNVVAAGLTTEAPGVGALPKPNPHGSITFAHSSYHRYSPISTLAKQWRRPLGRRTALIVRANEGCLVKGGVESVLKTLKHFPAGLDHGAGGGGGGANDLYGVPENAAAAAVPPPPAVEHHDAAGGSGVRDLLDFGSVLSDGTTSSSTAAAASSDPFGSDLLGGGDPPSASAPPPPPAPVESGNPFDLLDSSSTSTGTMSEYGDYYASQRSRPPPPSEPSHQPPPPQQQQMPPQQEQMPPQQQETKTATTTTTKKPSKFQAGTKFLQRVAKKAHADIERGVTGLAIRADKGRNPDWVFAAVYVVHPSSGTEECVAMTDRVHLPEEGEEGRKGGVLFGIPLVLPGFLDPSSVVQVRFLIRSGASLLAKAKKNYVVGYANVAVSSLRSPLSSQSSRRPPSDPIRPRHGFLSLPLRSSIVKDAKLDLCVVDDWKVPRLGGRGWTVTDPSDSGYDGGTFNHPLDQGYAYHLAAPPVGPADPGTASTGIVLGIERSIESTVVLPLASALADLFDDAFRASAAHAASAIRYLRSNSLSLNESDPVSATEMGHADCSLEISYLLQPPEPIAVGTSQATAFPTRANVYVALQRPDTVFEHPLGGGSVPLYYDSADPAHRPNYPLDTDASVSMPFRPRIFMASDPHLLPGVAGSLGPNARHVGTLRFELRVEDAAGNARVVDSPFGAVGTGSHVPAEPRRTLVGHVPLEPCLDVEQGKPSSVALCDVESGVQAGWLVVTIRATAPAATKPPPVIASSAGGLVSLSGLDALTEDSGAGPHVDCDPSPPPNAAAAALANQTPDGAAKHRRRSQLSTMGDFMTAGYLERHAATARAADGRILEERREEYARALAISTAAGDGESNRAPCQRRAPRPFRPSSSRMERKLSGLPFNVHVQTLALTAINERGGVEGGAGGGKGRGGALFHNVTHGAPADHARGFGSVNGSGGNDKQGSSSSSSSSSSLPPPAPPSTPSGNADHSPSAVGSIGDVSGGLRRLESKRLELAKLVSDAQSNLIQAVGSHFAAKARSSVQIPGSSRRHVPPTDRRIARLRSVATETAQALHSLTWTCASRRTGVFSQALGIAVTSYLSSVGDESKIGRGWPRVWAERGYLIVFEGLLTAAGKELGMIEDASVGVAMLRMVSVVFAPEHGGRGGGDGGGGTTTGSSSSRVDVPHSQHIKWISLTPSGVGSKTQFKLVIGLDPAYYAQRIPPPLQNGAAVRFYPLLYQVGVDIRQWGANAMSAQNRMKGGGGAPGAAGQSQPPRQPSPYDDDADDAAPPPPSGTGGMIDDEDDDVGIPDNDVLVALNYEAYRKMNAYAHSVSPVVGSAPPAAAAPPPSSSSFNAAEMNQPPHPLLARLQDDIKASAGKMAHGVLDEAATIAQRLGGGGTVFCKSGKDRTAMQVTFKQAQFARRYLRGGGGDANAGADVAVPPDEVFADASMMRIHGTRIPICEKNVGESKFAFNSLQVKFMPDMLKPPPNTISALLKRPET